MGGAECRHSIGPCAVFIGSVHCLIHWPSPPLSPAPPETRTVHAAANEQHGTTWTALRPPTGVAAETLSWSSCRVYDWCSSSTPLVEKAWSVILGLASTGALKAQGMWRWPTRRVSWTTESESRVAGRWTESSHCALCVCISHTRHSGSGTRILTVCAYGLFGL